ncbi:hypothetical protein FGO68_gene13371 [Halteria grandinella]|uniref:Uncharacterized protein n=1 Tax=Halteria grandinella TaxID=5974 RepID=A0A8J8NHX6_HALGN|nr:hypothetical protein FGO68_gene13371 [Halteria grandinella]
MHVFDAFQNLIYNVLFVYFFKNICSDDCMQISFHVFKYQIYISIVFCSMNIVQSYDIMMIQFIKEHNLSKCSLGICCILKSIKYFFQCYTGIFTSFIDCFPNLIIQEYNTIPYAPLPIRLTISYLFNICGSMSSDILQNKQYHNNVCLITNRNATRIFNPTNIQIHFYARSLVAYFSSAYFNYYFPFLTLTNTSSILKSMRSSRVPYSITIRFISLNSSFIFFIFSPKF